MHRREFFGRLIRWAVGGVAACVLPGPQATTLEEPDAAVVLGTMDVDATVQHYVDLFADDRRWERLGAEMGQAVSEGILKAMTSPTFMAKLIKGLPPDILCCGGEVGWGK